MTNEIKSSRIPTTTEPKRLSFGSNARLFGSREPQFQMGHSLRNKPIACFKMKPNSKGEQVPDDETVFVYANPTHAGRDIFRQRGIAVKKARGMIYNVVRDPSKRSYAGYHWTYLDSKKCILPQNKMPFIPNPKEDKICQSN